MNSFRTTAAWWAAALAMVTAMAGCGGGDTTTVGGTVSGLPAGSAVSLQNEGSSTLVVAANGAFTFDKKFIEGEHYDVTVSVQPTGASCTVANGKGRIDDDATAVTNVSVVCVPAFSISGTISGLPDSTTTTLQNNDRDSLVLQANGFFVFPTFLPTGATYDVTVTEQPTGRTCRVTQGTGTVQTSNVTSVVVTCS
jgi:hypothetical protein